MTFSARDRRILTEIESDLAATDPRLARALGRGKLSKLRRISVVASGHLERGRRGWTAGVLALLLSGLALLVIGLELHMIVLICIGVPLAQFGPVLALYAFRRTHRGGAARQPSARALG
jgi:hypothetical protein